MTVSQEMIHIDMGPWQWPLLRWFLSSQISREEIYVIENKQRECFYDIIPRLYCYPIIWCCCHKSYNAYWWPFCCNDSINCFNLCDGDSDTTNYIQIALTQDALTFQNMCFKRCVFLPIAILWCCVYNRISVSVNINHNLINILENYGYPLRINPNVQNTGGFGTGNASSGPDYAQMHDHDNAYGGSGGHGGGHGGGAEGGGYDYNNNNNGGYEQPMTMGNGYDHETNHAI